MPVTEVADIPPSVAMTPCPPLAVASDAADRIAREPAARRIR
jgi:hypothetical protein